MVAIRTISDELRTHGGAEQRALAEKLRTQSAESLVKRPVSNFGPRKPASDSTALEATRIAALKEWTENFGKTPLSGALLSRLRESGTGLLFEPIVLIDGSQRALGCLAEGLRTFEVSGRSGTFKLSSVFSRFRLGPVIEALARREIEPSSLDRQIDALLNIKAH